MSKETEKRIRQLGHRLGERNCVVWAEYECVTCGMKATFDRSTGGPHVGPILIDACTGGRKTEEFKVPDSVVLSPRTFIPDVAVAAEVSKSTNEIMKKSTKKKKHKQFPCGDSFCYASCDMCAFPRGTQILHEKCGRVHEPDEACMEQVK